MASMCWGLSRLFMLGFSSDVAGSASASGHPGIGRVLTLCSMTLLGRQCKHIGPTSTTHRGEKGGDVSEREHRGDGDDAGG